MKPNLFLVSFIFMMVLPSCDTNRPLVADQPWSLEFNNGGCVDVCKAYTIFIKNNGEYTYNGKFNVKFRGKKTGMIKDASLGELQNLIAKIKWKQLPPSYDEDTPRKELTYQSSSEAISKKVVYSRLAPPNIRNLEKFINTIIEQDDF